MLRNKPLRVSDPKARAEVPVHKAKKCRQCKETYTPVRSMQLVCSGTCGIAYAQAQTVKTVKEGQKAERKRDAERKEKLKTRSDWMKETQHEFNRYIRLRDAGKVCISCGRDHQGQWHAGHYLSVGARPEHRFDVDNVHKQCQPCNTHLHGNVAMYRARLVELLGSGVVARLEGPSGAKHYDIDDLKAIKAKYRALANQLEKRNG